MEEWVRVSMIGGREARQLMGGHRAEVMMIDKAWGTKSIGVGVQ